jgi:hypothetical protein
VATSVDTQVKLGKLPAKSDPRTLMLVRYVDRTALPVPPATLDLAAHVSEWPMYANDRLGDCTCAAAAHMIEAWTGAADGRAVEVAESAVVRAFDAVKVVDPATGEEGAVELDVLKYWRRTGIADHKIGAFARISKHDHELLQTGAYLFGGLYIGLQLPLTAQAQTIWDWTHQLTGPAEPGSWGGHAVDVVRYDERTLTVVTWGTLKEMTWAFWDRYVDEAYCLISKDFLRGRTTPNGFDLASLKKELAMVTDES